MLCHRRTCRAMRWSTALPHVRRARRFPSATCAERSAKDSVISGLSWGSISGLSWGSTSTSGQTTRRQSAVKSRISLCLWIGKPPILHAIAWLTETAPPHAPRSGRCCRCQSYRSASASLNAPLCKNNTWSSTGMAVSHDDVPFSCRRSSLRELMFPEDRSVSNSSFSFSLRMTVCALFALGAAVTGLNALSHSCRSSLIASVRVLATNFDVWCSCALVVTGSRIPRPLKRERRARRRRVSSDIAVWPVNAGKQLFLIAFSKVGAKADCFARITRWM